MKLKFNFVLPNEKIYLHQVLKTTGFFEGLFDEEELISENVKDRDSKLAFLNKVITVVGKISSLILL